MIIWSNAELWWIINKPRRKDIILVDFEVHCVVAPSAEPTRNLRRPLGPRDAQKRSRNCTRHLFKLSTSPPQIGLHVWGIYFAYLVVWNTIRITSNYCPPDRQYDFECCSKSSKNAMPKLQTVLILVWESYKLERKNKCDRASLNKIRIALSYVHIFVLEYNKLIQLWLLQSIRI